MKVQLQNLGKVNKNMVTLETARGTLEITFSYKTPISFEQRDFTAPDGQRFKKATRKNDWSTTTGKLLNECEPDKSKRIDGAEFEKQLENALAKL